MQLTTAHDPAANPFAGFWMGGYEGADHVTADGRALDMVRASGHLDQLDADHRRAAEAGLACVRESIGWRLCETSGGTSGGGPGGTIDLARVERVARSARRHGLQVLWTLMHYGLPDDLSLHDDALIPRFERFAATVARVVGDLSDAPPVYTPVNEIGYLAWIASQPGHLHPRNGLANGLATGDGESSRISGYAIKCRLARAAIGAVRAMRAIDPRARFLHVEPVVHVVPPPGAVDAIEQAEWQALTDEVASWQWQAWDLLSGRLEPGYGGSDAVLDTVGVNHYHSSQWELLTEQRLPWHLRDARRRPMADLLDGVWRRYGRPIVVAETSHVGVGRADWLHEMAAELRTAQRRGVPVQGLCVYPLTDRPDWNEPSRWHRSGLWHVAVGGGGDGDRAGGGGGDSGHGDAVDNAGADLPRVIEFETARALRQWQGDRERETPHAAGARANQAHQAHRAHSAHLARRPWLVVFSRQRWGPAQHRLQPLAARLAGRWSVVFVEPPRADVGVHAAPWAGVAVAVDGDPATAAHAIGATDATGTTDARGAQPGWRIDRQSQGPQLDVLVPCHAGPRADAEAGSPDWAASAELQRALRTWLAEHGAADTPPIVWIDLLSAWPLARALAPRATVWDAATPPPSDVPGPLHWRDLPHGVDLARHAASQGVPPGWAQEEARGLLRPFDGPRLACLFAPDVEIDGALLQAVARARPGWQLLLIGAAPDGPTAPNLHRLGSPPQALLPALLAACRIGVLPIKSASVRTDGTGAFGADSANYRAGQIASAGTIAGATHVATHVATAGTRARALDATTDITWPAALLDALAASLPVVMSGLAAPVGARAIGLTCADGAAAFVRACDAALDESPSAAAARRAAARAWLAPHDWDHVADTVHRQLLDAAAIGAAAAAAAIDATTATAPSHAETRSDVRLAHL